MKAWAVVEAGKPLQEVELPTPEPAGTEVLLEVTHCGVCHSDLHFWKGEYNMGNGNVMKLSDRGVTLPRAPGHEIVGRVLRWGPDAQGVKQGDVRVVFPWLGCGKCKACLAEQDNMCATPRSIGVVQHGGFGSHVLVPHPRYLVDPGKVPPALAATYACSGITVYSALTKLLPLDPELPVLLIGAGGLGLMAIAMLQAFDHRKIVSVDTSEEKREAAMAAGATAVVDGTAADLTARVLAATGGPVMAAIDFVNASTTARMGFDVLGKGGKLIVVGVAGGEITLSLAGLVFRANSISGSATGTPQNLRDVMALANQGKLMPTPISIYPRRDANQALLDLKNGKITGRVVLSDAEN